DVSVDRERRQSVYALARARPMNLQPIHLLGFAQPEDFTGIITRHETSTRIFQTGVNLPSYTPFDGGTNRRRVSHGSHQLESQPIVLAFRIVIKEQRRPAVDADQDVGIAVIVQVPDRQAAS